VSRMVRPRQILFRSTLLVMAFACGEEGGLSRGQTEEEPLGIFIDPDDASVPVGSTLQLQATGLYDDRETADLTHVVTWHVSRRSVAKVGNRLDQEGLLTAKREGEVEVWATVGEVASSVAVVNVIDADLDGLTVEPSSLAIGVDETVEMKASAFFTDGSTSDASGQVRWVVEDPLVARFEQGDRLLGVGPGHTNVQAVWGEVTSAIVPVDVLMDAKADLKVTSIAGYVSPAGAELSVVIRNDGAVGASSFWVDAWVDPHGEKTQGDVGESFASVGYLGPGAERALSLEVTGLASGSHEVLVVVDLEGDISESNESNNQLSMDLHIEDGKLPADLYVDWFTYLADDEYIYYWVEVSNYGDTDTGPFWVDFFVDRSIAPSVGLDGDAWAEVSNVGPWETVVVDLLVAADCYWCWSWVVVDSTEVVMESFEDDNVAGPLDVFSE
jgi:hypothetical protein